MRRFLIRLLVMGVAFLIITTYVPGIELSGSWASAFLAAAVFALLNVLVLPIAWLLKLIAFPLNFITLGAMSLVITFALNVAVFWLMGTLELGIRVQEDSALLWAPLSFVIITGVLNFILVPPKAEE